MYQCKKCFARSINCECGEDHEIEWTDEPVTRNDSVPRTNLHNDNQRLNWLGDPWPYVAGDPHY